MGVSLIFVNMTEETDIKYGSKCKKKALVGISDVSIARSIDLL